MTIIPFTGTVKLADALLADALLAPPPPPRRPGRARMPSRRRTPRPPSRGSSPQQLVAFVALHFLGGAEILEEGPLPPCGAAKCVLLQWLQQAHAMAHEIGRLSGQSTGVQLFTKCLNPEVGDSLTRLGTARVTIHDAHAPAMVKAVRALRAHHMASGCCPQSKYKFLTLLKWQVVSMVEVQLAVFLDIDVEILPVRAFRAGRASSWLSMIRCALAQPASLLSWPDHSSPINAGLMLVRPSLRMYEEGMRVLRRRSFNETHGWDLVGRPSEAVPAADDAWKLSPGHLEMLNRDSWRFVHGGLDQGFFFYLFRVLHREGADYRLSRCAAAALEGGTADRMAAANAAVQPAAASAASAAAASGAAPVAPSSVAALHHYASGCKPEGCLLSCVRPRATAAGRDARRPFSRRPPRYLEELQTGTGAAGKRRMPILVAARTLSWGARTAGSLSALAARVKALDMALDQGPAGRNRSFAPSRRLHKSLRRCVSALRDGVRCARAWLETLEVAPCTSFHWCAALDPKAMQKPTVKAVKIMPPIDHLDRLEQLSEAGLPQQSLADGPLRVIYQAATPQYRDDLRLGQHAEQWRRWWKVERAGSLTS